MTPSSLSAVEIVHLENGNPLAVRTLSHLRDRTGARRALAVVVLGAAVGAGASFGLAQLLGKAIYVPGFVAVWALTAFAAGRLAVRAVSRRLSRFMIGPRLDNDAFAQVPADFSLVTRRGARFEVALVPGMHGYIESGRAPLPIETLLGEGQTVISLDEGATAEVYFGSSQFVIRSRKFPAVPPVSAEWTRPFARAGFLALQLGLVASVLCFVPAGRSIDDRAAGRMLRKAATPWEAEKWLRVQAQQQAPSLYTCFNVLPMACQRSGYVGVGVSLSRDGDIRSRWIARSTYAADCPVEKCMSDVISTWQFDPVPQAMRLILPVQVLRTEKPLAELHVAQGGGDGEARMRGGDGRAALAR